MEFNLAKDCQMPYWVWSVPDPFTISTDIYRDAYHVAIVSKRNLQVDEVADELGIGLLVLTCNLSSDYVDSFEGLVGLEIDPVNHPKGAY